MGESTTLRRGVSDEVRVELQADAALALTARMFVTTAARHFGLDERRIEDVRLAASELFTNAVERAGGPVRFGVGRLDDELLIRADGVGPLGDVASVAADPTRDPVAASRRDLLEALFRDGGISVDDAGSVTIVVTIEP